MNRIVDVKEAILAYLDGKKVRRYMPMEEFIKHNEIQLNEGKRITDKHSWWENWVWNDGSGKKVKKYDINEVLSPIEAFERNGYNLNKKWEINERV